MKDFLMKPIVPVYQNRWCFVDFANFNPLLTPFGYLSKLSKMLYFGLFNVEELTILRSILWNDSSWGKLWLLSAMIIEYQDLAKNWAFHVFSLPGLFSHYGWEMTKISTVPVQHRCSTFSIGHSTTPANCGNQRFTIM